MFAALKLLMTIMTCDNEAFKASGTLGRESGKEDFGKTRVSAPVVVNDEEEKRRIVRRFAAVDAIIPAELQSVATPQYRRYRLPISLRFLLFFSPCQLSLSLSLRIHLHARTQEALLGCFSYQPFGGFGHLATTLF